MAASLDLKMGKGWSDSCMIVEVDDDALNLSGDTGVVGRFKVREGRIVLDLKGTVYEGAYTPCTTLMAVTMGSDTARVEHLTNHVVQATRTGNIFDKEQVISGHYEQESDVLDENVNETEPLRKKRK